MRKLELFTHPTDTTDPLGPTGAPEKACASGTSAWAGVLFVGLALLAGCAVIDQSFGTSLGESGEQAAGTVNSAAVKVNEAAANAQTAALAARALSGFGPLPASVPKPSNLGTEAKIELGRMLYYEPRLSKNHDVSCNSCHLLDAFGVDGEKTSPGHRKQRGERNSPTVYNAALHLAQFWDGRAADVEEQAKGPILNPVEMASASEADVIAILNSIPGYVDAFAAAYPAQMQPVTYENLAKAIGAFERKLMTPGRFDQFMKGDLKALSEQERRGFETFLAVGCNTCHTGPALGGQLYRKLGFIFPYETKDLGRETVTGLAADRHVFKVPSLRNVAKTGPYLHDGSIAELSEVVRIMGYHQLGQQLTDAQIADIVAFLRALTGEVDRSYIARPRLPANGPRTPAPDPN